MTLHVYSIDYFETGCVCLGCNQTGLSRLEIGEGPALLYLPLLSWLSAVTVESKIIDQRRPVTASQPHSSLGIQRPLNASPLPKPGYEFLALSRLHLCFVSVYQIPNNFRKNRNLSY